MPSGRARGVQNPVDDVEETCSGVKECPDFELTTSSSPEIGCPGLLQYHQILLRRLIRVGQQSLRVRQRRALGAFVSFVSFDSSELCHLFICNCKEAE